MEHVSAEDTTVVLAGAQAYSLSNAVSKPADVRLANIGRAQESGDDNSRSGTISTGKPTGESKLCGWSAALREPEEPED